MNSALLEHKCNVPENSGLDKQDYLKFLENAYRQMSKCPLYFSGNDGMEVWKFWNWHICCLKCLKPC